MGKVFIGLLLAIYVSLFFVKIRVTIPRSVAIGRYFDGETAKAVTASKPTPRFAPLARRSRG